MTEQLRFDWEDLERRAVPALWTVDEIFGTSTADTLPLFYEDSRVERKAAGIHAESLSICVCMWANTPPDGGVVLLGVEDDGSLSGCASNAQRLADIERRIRAELVQDARFRIQNVQVVNTAGQTDFVSIVRVEYRSDKVVETNKGEAWIRRGNSKHLLSSEERHELAIERGQVSFELEACDLKFPDKFDLEAIRAWVGNIRRQKGIGDELDTEQVLCHHRLGKITQGEFRPNNACALLFALQPQDVVQGDMIRFQRIEGIQTETGGQRNVVQDKTVTGPMPYMIDECARIVDSQIRTYSRLGRDGKFYTAPEYPREAWYEMIVNACAHRSYTLKGMHIWVRMFDDKFVVESPGPFPPMVTPENIYEVHHRRNWWLMDGMMYLDLVKCENEGVKRIRSAMAQMALPAPEFEQRQGALPIVRVTLRNNHNLREKWIDADARAVVGSELAEQLSDWERRIVNFAAEHGGKIKTTEAMKLSEKPRWGTADATLEKLAEQGIFRKVSGYARDPRTHYVLQSQPSTGKP